MHLSACHPTGIAGLDAITILSDRTFPRHTHDEFGFGPLLRGGQESWSGRGHVEANPGDVIAVNPGEVHDGIGCPGQPRQWHVVYLTPELVGRLTEFEADRVEFTQPVVGLSALHRAMTDAIAAIIVETPDIAQIEEALVHVIGLLREERAPDPGPRARLSRAVANVRARLHDEVAAPLTLADLAKTAGLSRFQTLRLFKAEVGATPHAYLTQQRVKRAKALISGGMPLAEASFAAGFADQAHMTRAFGRQLGVTPGAYRRAQTAREGARRGQT